MEIKELVDALKKMKGKDPATIAMTFLSTPQGAKVLTGLLKTKETMDKRLRRTWDFLGFPSYSDQEKVDRAIGRVGSRIREIENNLEELDRTLSQLETSLEKSEENPIEVHAPETTNEEPALKPSAPVGGKSSLLLFRPVEKAGKVEQKTVAIKKADTKPAKKKSPAAVSRKAVTTVKSKTPAVAKPAKKKPIATQKPVLSRSPLLNLKFKK